jgi:hypothetical protein
MKQQEDREMTILEKQMAAAEMSLLKPAVSTKQLIIRGVQSASMEIQGAVQAAMSKNAMAADVPVFHRLQAIQKELTTVLLEINKLRGLD